MVTQYTCPACGHTPMGMGEMIGDTKKGRMIAQCCRQTVHSWDYTEEGLAKTYEADEAARIQADVEAAEILRLEAIAEKRRDNLTKARAARAAQLAAEKEEEGENS